MKKSILGLLSLAVVSLAATVAQAGVISVEGDVGIRAPGSTGVLEIQFNTQPENRTFLNGSIGLALTYDTPGVIAFTGAEILNGGRWAALGAINVTPDSTGTLNAFSLNTPGLPAGTDTVYARVNYQVVGSGLTHVSVATSGEDPLFDGSIPPFGADVSGEFTFVGAQISTVPEPATMAMAGLSLIGLVLRRRNG